MQRNRRAIRDALAIEAHSREQDISQSSQREFRERLATLTADERQVLDYMLEGLANKVIARRADVSIRTVENRRQRVFEKTATDSLAPSVIPCTRS